MPISENLPIKFSDVTQELWGTGTNGKSLIGSDPNTDAFAKADNFYFHPSFKGNKDRLTNFRGYPYKISFQNIVDTDPYIRNEENIRYYNLSYTKGNGQSVTEGSVISQVSSNGTVYTVHVGETKILNGDGLLYVYVSMTPSMTENRGNLMSFYFLNSLVVISILYDSLPILTDIVKTLDAGQTYVFSDTDFVSHYSDYDGDPLTHITITYPEYVNEINTSYGLFYNNNHLSSPTVIIPIDDIINGQLKYIAGPYENSINMTWDYYKI